MLWLGAHLSRCLLSLQSSLCVSSGCCCYVTSHSIQLPSQIIFLPRLNILEAHTGSPHPSALPTKYTQVCEQRQSHECAWLFSREQQGALPSPAISLCALVTVLTVLFFFTVLGIGLCFEFVLKTVLIIQGCFSYCWAVLTQSQSLFCFSLHPTSE